MIHDLNKMTWLALMAVCLSVNYCNSEELPASCVFAGEEAEFVFSKPSGPVEWKLAAAGRTISQGTAEQAADGRNAEPRLRIAVRLPEVRPGVVMNAELQLTWHEAGRQAKQRQPVTIYSPDPFSVRQAELEGARIALFDPVGKTADTFTRNEIPHTLASNLSAIDRINDGVVIVGEGTMFREHSSLADALTRAAARGVPILCLAPLDAAFVFPQPDSTSTAPQRVAFEQADVLRCYDKRFDLLSPISRLTLEPRRSGVFVRASESEAGWPWYDVQYVTDQTGAPQGRLIVCGLGLIRDWDMNPIPRYLLVHLLEELTSAPSAKENERNDITQR